MTLNTDPFRTLTMPDYTPLGIEKISQQAKADLTLIRCPRDGAVMRVLGCRTKDTDGGFRVVPLRRSMVGSHCIVTNVDVECPACRRRAMRVDLIPALAESTSMSPGVESLSNERPKATVTTVPSRLVSSHLAETTRYR